MALFFKKDRGIALNDTPICRPYMGVTYIFIRFSQIYSKSA
nr:MAG TPA: hypothetical protein [Caudoviricetes sp.]